MRILPSSGVLAVLLLCAASVGAAPARDALVVSVDGRHYITFEPIAISPAERLVQAPELRMHRCGRRGDAPLAAGPFRLIYSAGGDFLDAVSLRVRFNPTRIELGTAHGDVSCAGEALGHESGVDRIFRDHFEP